MVVYVFVSTVANFTACSGSRLQLNEDPTYSAANENKAKKDLGRLPAIVAGLHVHVLVQKLEKHPIAFSILHALPC